MVVSPAVVDVDEEGVCLRSSMFVLSPSPCDGNNNPLFIADNIGPSAFLGFILDVICDRYSGYMNGALRTCCCDEFIIEIADFGMEEYNGGSSLTTNAG